MNNEELHQKVNHVSHTVKVWAEACSLGSDFQEVVDEFRRRRKVLREALTHIKEYCSDGLTVDADTILEVVKAALKEEEGNG